MRRGKFGENSAPPRLSGEILVLARKALSLGRPLASKAWRGRRPDRSQKTCRVWATENLPATLRWPLTKISLSFPAVVLRTPCRQAACRVAYLTSLIYNGLYNNSYAYRSISCKSFGVNPPIAAPKIATMALEGFLSHWRLLASRRTPTAPNQSACQAQFQPSLSAGQSRARPLPAPIFKKRKRGGC